MKLIFKQSLIILILFLTACDNQEFEPISEKLPIIGTVNIKDMTVSFINMDKKQIVTSWELEKPYSGGLILSDGDTLLLFGKQVETVDLYSLKKGSKIGSWETGKGIVNGRLLSNKKEVVFADQFHHKARFFDLEGKETKSINTNENPLTILENELDHKLYVLSFSSKELNVIDLNEKKRTDSYHIHSSASGAILKENENEIWVGGHGAGAEIENNIHVYDLSSGRLKKKISAPLMPVNFLEKNDFIYTLSHGSSTLYKVDQSGKVSDSTKVGANPFEMSAVNRYIVIAGYDSNDISIVDPDSLQILKTIKVGKGPFQIFVRGGKEN